jgi:hypothetical protein
MARRGRPPACDLREEPDVQITVVPRQRTLGRRASVHARAIGALVFTACVATAAVGAFLASRPGVRRVGASRSRLTGAAAVAAAYRYPLACLSVTISASDPAYARAELDRASPCWRYGGYVTAIFHRTDGAWRLVLDVGSYPCPVRSLPAVVQAQLGVCPSIPAP